MSGFGTQPLGTTAAGLGHLAGIPLPGQAYESGPEFQTTREIDPVLRDYVATDDDTGVPYDGMDPIDERVLIALTTRRGSLAMALDFGNNLLSATKDDGNLQRLAEREVDIALRVMLDAREVRVLSVQAQRVGSALFAVVSYENIAAKTEQQIRTAL